MNKDFLKSLRSQTDVPEDSSATTTAKSDFAKLFQAEEAEKPKVPGVVIGRVVAVRDDLGYVIVDIRHKSEGKIDIRQFRDENGVIAVMVGDEVEVYADLADDDAGVDLSKEKAVRVRMWDKISVACENDEVVRGRIVAKVKGGLSVNLDGVKAFFPGSQVDIRPTRTLDKFVTDDSEFEFKVIKFNRRRGNIVLSRRVLLEKDRAKQKADTMAHLKEGNVLRGVVKNVTNYGAFIDLGGIDGLLHITDMSWGRVTDPREVLGDNPENTPIEVKVLRFNPETERVSLGLKQLKGDPWHSVLERYTVNQRVKGRVVSLVEYGAFLELEEGLEGLIHVSEMSWTGNIKSPSRLFAKDDEVEAQILDIDVENRRISLGYKQTLENPWVELQQHFPPGSVIRGTIRNITDFGIFVSITQEIDGLVHISDLSWTQKVKHPSDLYQKGQTVEAVVLNVDVENQRFSLGIKQLTQDLWESEIPGRYGVGRVVKGTVNKLESYGAFVELDEGIEGLIHISELSDQRIQHPSEVVQEGQTVVVEVINIDRIERKIALSLRSTDVSGHQDLINYMSDEAASNAGFTSSFGVKTDEE